MVVVRQGRIGWVKRRRRSSTMSITRPQGHRHEELELNLVVRGTMTLIADAARLRVGADTLLWLRPDRGHLLLEESEDLDIIVAVWRPQVHSEMSTRTDIDRPRRLDERRSADLIATATRLSDIDADADDEHHAVGMKWLLAEAAAAYDACDDLPMGSALHPAVEQAAAWLATHASNEASNDLADLARRCGLSRSRLSRLFVKQIGTTLVEYRQRCRLDVSLRLLGAGGRDGTPGRVNLLEAALAGGFGSYSQFYRAHLRHLGRPPSKRHEPRRAASK